MRLTNLFARLKNGLFPLERMQFLLSVMYSLISKLATIGVLLTAYENI